MNKHPISALRGKVRVVLVDLYGCGTIWAVLEDEAGRRCVVCLDGRVGSPTRCRLFENARLPGKPDAKLIELGSSEEDLVIATLSRWYDSEEFTGVPEFKQALQDALLNLRLWDPDYGAPPLPPISWLSAMRG
jgi:hypothetical protein